MIHIETIQTRLPELEQLWKLKDSAAESYTLAVKAAAEQAHCEPAALKAYIRARMRNEVEQLQVQQEQLSLMLESCE